MATVQYSLLIFFTIYSAVRGDGNGFPDHWNYDLASDHGPAHWKDFDPNCGGRQQSPINIETANTIVDNTLSSLSLGNYKTTNMANLDFVLQNTGSAAVVSVKRNNSTDNSPVYVTHQDATYRLVQFHVHWGNTSANGSEHTLNGKQFPAEIHFVHYNTKYPSFSESLNKTDGLLVWGHFIDISSINNTNWNVLTNAIDEVKFPGKEVKLADMALYNLVSNNSETNYYTYSGSLTTPTCNEIVTWVVSQQVIKISEVQLNAFRHLRVYANESYTREIVSNYRPVQDLFGRILYRYDGPVSQCSSSIPVIASVVSVIIPLVVIFLTEIN